MRSRRWKWIGLGAVAAIAVGSAVVVQRRRERQWRDYEPAEIRSRLHERFAAVRSDAPAADGKPGAIAYARRRSDGK